MFPIVEKRDRQAVRESLSDCPSQFRWTNEPWDLSVTSTKPSQIRTRPIPMSEEDVRAARKLTGSSPYFEKKFVPVAHGRPRSQTRKKKA